MKPAGHVAQLCPCTTPGCGRRFWRKRGYGPNTCPRCRAAVIDQQQKQEAEKQPVAVRTVKPRRRRPERTPIPEREALLLEWMRAG